ncbi:LLM class flavin-dependent oxidoreductase [Williamsia phyllosphaerae]|uniref:FMNH2-utilizing oxygenase n=1 Tax=Williamsia phyllosphaerae TaxID=885042 RepID=A0ABQ1V4V1_9NOCA|nr:LLM class flavin-dependent oxidoreductase [Williamsia phyllosphaerae]GGF36798.1 FMNH2-utilizing oxygenase [Williamsia phyllosphaerae]
MPEPIRVAIALEGAGAHPAAWREESARPDELLTPQYWTEQIRHAESAGADLVTISDSFSVHRTLPDCRRTDLLVGHLDATLIAARVAPVTQSIGLIPTATVTHSEPFHLSKAIATVDHVSHGRAGILLRPSGRTDEAALFGRRDASGLSPEDHRVEVADYAEVLRRLWDSWEDDAEIRDVATGRFIDRDKLHYIDFEGRYFSVRGPSITPRPPQGQPVVAVSVENADDHRLAGESADVVFVAGRTADDVRTTVDGVEAARSAAGRDGREHVFVDLTVYLGATTEAATVRKNRLDNRAPVDVTAIGNRDDAAVFVGTATDLADRVTELVGPDTGATGVRLRPGTIPDDLHAVTTDLIPELARRGLADPARTASTLRGRLGLDSPVNRYATGGVR